MAAYIETAKQMNVEVEMQNHPIFDGTLERLARLKTATPDDPNPFVIGNGRYLAMWNIVSECIQAEIARFRSSGMLTDRWIVLQFCQFEQGRRRLAENGSPALFVRGMLLGGDGTNPQLLAEATLTMPG